MDCDQSHTSMVRSGANHFRTHDSTQAHDRLEAKLAEAEARVAELVEQNKALVQATGRLSPTRHAFRDLTPNDSGQLRTFDRIVKNTDIVVHATPGEVRVCESQSNKLRRHVCYATNTACYKTHHTFYRS